MDTEFNFLSTEAINKIVKKNTQIKKNIEVKSTIYSTYIPYLFLFIVILVIIVGIDRFVLKHNKAETKHKRDY